MSVSEPGAFWRRNTPPRRLSVFDEAIGGGYYQPMQAILVRETGGPAVMRPEALEAPAAAEGQALVRVHTAGVNYIDTYHRSGLYPKEPPFIPGLEGAGVIEAIGPSAGGTEVAAAGAATEALRPGERVAWTDIPGSYAEYVIAPVNRLVRVPAGLRLEQAAAAMLQGMTAHYLSRDTAPIREGSRILVHAAAGGVGLLLTQMAKRRGAYVYGTVSTPEKAALAEEAGCDRIINYREEDFAEVIRRENPEGIDTVYDSVGRDTLARSMDCLRRRGMLVSFGQSSGAVEPIDPRVFSQKGSLFFTRPSLMDYVVRDEELYRRAEDVFEWLGSGELALRIGETWPLLEAQRAHERLEGRLTTGKVLLQVGESRDG